MPKERWIIHPGSGILKKSHIQVVVRDREVILGYFPPGILHLERKSQSIAVKQHGTRQPTVTAQPTPDQIVVAMRVALGRIRRMSHRDRVASLKEAGILTTSGKLAAGYK